MPRRIYHVTPAGDQWRIMREGAVRPTRVMFDKSKAIAKAKRLAKKMGLGQVVVHRKSGRIEKEFTYGKDPRRTRG